MGDAGGPRRLALMVGLPRSGKTTYAKAMQEAGWVRICPDEFRMALHGRPFHAPAEDTVWAAVFLAARALLLSGHSVVADATNVSRRRRAPWIALGRELGVPVEAYVIAPDLAACRSRNGSPGGPGEPVPDEVLERMAARWEPVEEEGVAVRRV